MARDRQISYLALPPLLIPAPQPQPSNSPSQTPQASHATPVPTTNLTSAPAPPPSSHQPHLSASISTSTSSYGSGSLLRPIYHPPPQQRGSLIAFLQQQQLQQQLLHQAQQQQARTYNTTTSSMSSSEQIPEIITKTRAAASGTPGEAVEPRQTLPSEDMEPNPANSIPLPPNRQKLVDDIIALYSCQPTIERVARYAPGKSPFPPIDVLSCLASDLIACVYDDQFVYANGEYRVLAHLRATIDVDDRPIQDGRSVVWPTQALP